MKKLIGLVPLFVLVILPVIVFAKGEQNVQTGQQQDSSGYRATITSTVMPQGNQVQTQNQGEDSQLQINSQEQERLNEGSGAGSQSRNQMAIEHMSIVAKEVQELLQIRTSGGIGEQVRQIAQEQNQAQAQIQEQVNKISTRGGVAKFLFGTDFGAVKNLKQQLEHNRLRIGQLVELQNQIINQGDITAVQEAIQALMQENITLEDMITAEEQTRSVFGWLVRLFAI